MSRPTVFLDRDGTVIVEKHYLSDPEGVELLPGAAEGLRRMAELGCRLVLVTNQSGIGRGYYDEARLDEIHARLNELLAPEGVAFDAIYHCPHVPDAGCACRKPLTGMIDQAVAAFGLDPKASFVIGDKECDIALGAAVGAGTLLVRTGYGDAGEARPDHIVDDLAEAAEVIARTLKVDVPSSVNPLGAKEARS